MAHNLRVRRTPSGTGSIDHRGSPHETLRGSIALARPRDDDDPDDPGEPDDDDTPELKASVPAFALQIRADLGTNAGCLDAATAETVRSTVESTLRQQFPNADVREACVTTRDGVSATTVGVWTSATPPNGDGARELGLQRVDVIDRTEGVAIFVNAGFIRGQVHEQFDRIPKRYNGLGNPSPDGPIHITGFDLGFQRGEDDHGGRLILRVFGFDERPWPDVSFTTTYTDILSIGAGSTILCESLEPQLTDDRSLLNYVTTVLLGIITVAFTPAFFLTKGVLSAALQQPSNTPENPGVGGTIVRQFYPDAIMIPGPNKLDLIYTRVSVGGGGIVGAGIALPTPRQPRCSIAGPDRLSVDFRNPIAVGQFSIRAFEMRGDLKVQWSGEDVTSSTTTASSLITFTPRLHRKGVVKRELRALVTDADGLVATASRVVEIHLVDQEDDDIPPQCRAKPWMCE
jgi:hypothetical protein